MEFKHNPVAQQAIEKPHATASRVMHPITSRVLKGVA